MVRQRRIAIALGLASAGAGLSPLFHKMLATTDELQYDEMLD